MTDVQPEVQVFVECAADLPWAKDDRFNFTRKHFFPLNDINNFRDHYRNAGVYETVMRYINPIWIQDKKQRWVIDAEQSYKWGDFYLDFDYPLEQEGDFDKIRSDVQVAIRYLKIILAIDPDQVRIYFSGKKGIHVMVGADVLGLVPHSQLNMIYKDLAKDIERYTAFGTLDTGIYDNKRMFRMVNSFNHGGKSFKVPLTYEELCRMSLGEIRELAKQPRLIKQPPLSMSPKAKHALEKYIEKWTNAVTKRKEFSGKMMELKELPICITTMQEKVFRETVDERNNSGSALASFYMQQGVEKEEAMVRMEKWGSENCLPPLPYRDVKVIVNSIYEGGYKYGCDSFHRFSGVCDKVNCPLFKKG